MKSPNSIEYFDSSVRMPLMDLPVRAALVTLKDGQSILISPGSKLPQSSLPSDRNVIALVAPNLLHGGGIENAKAVYSKAQLWAPNGMQKHRPQTSWTHFFGKDTWPFDEELKLIPILGMPGVREYAFYHKASRTLIATDLAFNLLNPTGPAAWIWLTLFGTYKRFAMSRLFLAGVKNKTEFKNSMNELLKLDFDRLVVSHGETVEAGAKELIRSALKERGYL
jgi:hypothetical protein